MSERAIEDLIPVDMELIDRFTENLPHAVGLRPLPNGRDEIAASRIEERSMLTMVQARRVIVAWKQTNEDVRLVARFLAPPPAESSAMLEIRLSLIGMLRQLADALRMGAGVSFEALALEAMAVDLEKDV